jgi:hypothetical protein
LLAGIAGLVCTPGALAQQDIERRVERALRTADPAERRRVDPALTVAERSQLDVGGFLSFSYLHLTDSLDNSRRLFQPEVTLFGRVVIDGPHTFFVRSRFQYRDFSEGDSFDGRGDRWTSPFLDRYWYEFDMRQAAAAYEGRSIGGNINVRVGRQFVDWAGGLTLSENLLAGRTRFEFGRWTLDTLAGVTPGDESVTDFDASRRDFNRDTKRGFFGGLLSYRTRGNDEFYTYLLHQTDHNDSAPSRPPLPIDVDHDYESWYLGFGSSGSLSAQMLYLGEFVYQFGSSMSDPLRAFPDPQTKEDIGAWAARGQLTYLFADKNNSRAEFECIFASGDPDRLVTSDTVGGNLSGTIDRAFNSMGFVNTGLAFSPSLSNIMTFRVGGATSPFASVDGLENFQVGADFLFLNKMDTRAPITEPTNDDRFLGFETDLFVNYRITSDLAVSARYGVFFPGDAIAGEKHTRHFVFLGVTLSF